VAANNHRLSAADDSYRDIRAVEEPMVGNSIFYGQICTLAWFAALGRQPSQATKTLTALAVSDGEERGRNLAPRALSMVNWPSNIIFYCSQGSMGVAIPYKNAFSVSVGFLRIRNETITANTF
jgi:hypothetical protein